jgi:nicotinamide-nucleotide amidase
MHAAGDRRLALAVLMHDDLVTRLASALRSRGWRIATAESCTGGLIAAACTDLAGSSDWFDRGVVSYSNAAKAQALGVAPALIEAQGAVSAEVARAMAEGVLARSDADLVVAVTGVAGPTGGSAAKPVGTVWLAWSMHGPRGQPATDAVCEHFDGDRAAVRRATVERALAGLCERAERPGATPMRAEDGRR